MISEDIEISTAVADEIASWRRVFVGRHGADARDLLRKATADLRETLEIDRTVHPESHAAACQGTVDALQEMAEIGGIGPDDAQLIFAKAFNPAATPESEEGNTGTAPEANEKPWPVMDEAAYHGLAGDFVKALDPHTEADRAGVLIQFLSAFGSVVGNSPYYLVEGSRHRVNLFVVLVGKSSKSRKGTGADRVLQVLERADTTWFCEQTVSGLSSGEGLINHVRDPVKKWNAKDKCEDTIDPGVQDKRLFVTEPEFAGALSVMERHGNMLSSVIRNAWDGRRLQTLTKSSPLKATGAHISLIAHITKDEIRARLTRTDMANGFANRFLFCLVQRSKLLPHGGHFPEAELQNFSERIDAAAKFAEKIGRVTMTDEAAKAWAKSYEELSAERPGLLGAVTARAEAQVVRLSLIFALLDSKDTIDAVHLEAAMAIWAYCDQSATLIFGDSLGDPIADDILLVLRRNAAGMTRTDISNLFGRHRTSDQINAALAMLLRLGGAKFEGKQTGGRPVETWFAIGGSR